MLCLRVSRLEMITSHFERAAASFSIRDFQGFYSGKLPRSKFGRFALKADVQFLGTPCIFSIGIFSILVKYDFPILNFFLILYNNQYNMLADSTKWNYTGL